MNPKDIIGSKKAPLHVVPAPVLMEIGLGMLEGACKYGSFNFRAADVRASVYYDAAMRHLMAFWEGEDLDPDSGLHHVAKALSCLTVLRDGIMREQFVDDRPPRSRNGWVKEMNEKAKLILEKYPNPVPPYVEKNSTKQP